MKIGIISDSHGKAKRLRAAIDVLTDRGVETIVHCGDIGSRECMEVLGSASVPTYAIPGNMDRHAEQLAAIAARSGVEFSWEIVRVPIGDNEYLVATHGDDEDILGELITEGQFRYVCHGHTHHARDERIGKVRVINPGALHHARRHTIAVVDTATDELVHIELKD